MCFKTLFCRTVFILLRVATVFLLISAEQLEQLEVLQRSLEPLKEESNVCLCVMGLGPDPSMNMNIKRAADADAAEEENNVTRLLLLLLQWGFCRLCRVSF